MATTSGRRRIGRERILEVAEEMFASQGYRAVSIRDIARACGVTNAALYYHFPSKAALFREVLARHLEGLRRRMWAAQQEHSTYQAKLRAMLEVYAEMIHQRRASMFALRRDIGAWQEGQPEERHTLFLQAWQAVVEPIAAVIQEAIQAGKLRPAAEATTLATMLIGLLSGILLHQPAAQPDPSQAVGQALDVFLHGLEAEGPSHPGENDHE